MQFRDGARLGAQATRRRDAQARERRPLVGTARRRRANGAVLLSQVVQTRPRITPQIRKVQGRAIRAADEAPIAALSGRGADRRSAFQAVPALFRGRRYCGPPATRGYAGLKTGVPFPAAPSNPAAFRAPRPCRAGVPTGGRRLLTGGIRMVGVPVGPAFTQRLARVYFDRSATMSDAKRRGSAGMRRRPNAASRCPSAAKLTRLSGERLPESTVAQWQSSGLLIRWL